MVGNMQSESGLFQSTLPSRGATDEAAIGSTIVDISIHAPLAGSDKPPSVITTHNRNISIHAPLAGSDSSVFSSTGVA